MTNQETGEHLRQFTEREAKYLALIKQQNRVTPERLVNWRIWIQDSAIYLNELKNFAEQ